jgi:hypothetical protein
VTSKSVKLVSRVLLVLLARKVHADGRALKALAPPVMPVRLALPVPPVCKVNVEIRVPKVPR